MRLGARWPALFTRRRTSLRSLMPVLPLVYEGDVWKVVVKHFPVFLDVVDLLS